MQKLILIILTFTFLATSLSAQRGLRRADELFEKKYYVKAAEEYHRLARRNATNAHIITRLADSHRLLNDYEEAEKWYARAVALDGVQPEALFHYAHTLLFNNKFDESMQWMRNYLRLNPSDKRAQNQVNSEQELRELMNNPRDFSVIPLEGNSPYNDFAPAFHGQNQIVFVSGRQDNKPSRQRNTRDHTPLLKLYTAQVTGNRLANIMEFAPEIKENVHMGPVSFSPDGREIFFTRNVHLKPSRWESHVNRLQIFRARWDGRQWTDIEPLPFNSTRYSVGHPALSPDGRVLYFISDMPGGFGQTDIYRVERTYYGWTVPENLGAGINTAGREMFPFVHKDGTLYFSSDGHPTLGGLDIYYATPTSDGFDKPVNMGVPFNSSNDDISFIAVEGNKQGFFASNREDGQTDNIFFFTEAIPPDPAVPDEVIAEIEEEQPVPEEVPDPITTPEVTETIEEPVPVEITEVTPEEADPVTEIPEVADPVTVIPEEAEPVTEIPAVVPERETTLTTGIPDEFLPDEHGEKPAIYFDLAIHRLRDDAFPFLDNMVVFLRENPDKGVILNGHTDITGSSLFNIYLGQMRAHNAMRYLITNGIDPDRLHPLGHAENRPAVPGAQTSEEHQLNRRVEFEIIDNDQMQQKTQRLKSLSYLNLNTRQSTAFSPGVEFSVQLLATAIPSHPSFFEPIMEALPHIPVLYYYHASDRLHRYLAGNFEQYRDALAVERELRNAGFDTFVVAFQNGERITIREARRITGQ